MLTGCSSSYLSARLQPWPVLRGPTVLCCCPCSSQGTQSVGTNTHTTTHAAARTDRKDDMAVCPGLEPLRTRWMDTHTHTHTHNTCIHTHTKQAVGTLTFCPGNGSGCFGRFWAPTAPYGQCVFVCVCKCV